MEREEYWPVAAQRGRRGKGEIQNQGAAGVQIPVVSELLRASTGCLERKLSVVKLHAGRTRVLDGLTLTEIHTIAPGGGYGISSRRPMTGKRAAGGLLGRLFSFHSAS